MINSYKAILPLSNLYVIFIAVGLLCISQNCSLALMANPSNNEEVFCVQNKGSINSVAACFNNMVFESTICEGLESGASYFDIQVSFDQSAEQLESFFIFVNEELYLSFPFPYLEGQIYTFSFVDIEEGSESYVIRLEDSVTSCIGEFEISVLDCYSGCTIEEVAVESECLENELYSLTVFANISVSEDELVNVTWNGVNQGNYMVEHFPIELLGIQGDAEGNLQIAVLGQEECINEVSVFLPSCFDENPDCSFDDLEISISPCFNDSVWLYIESIGPVLGEVLSYQIGDSILVHQQGTTPFQLLLAGTGQELPIRVSLNDDNECYQDVVSAIPLCEAPVCGLADLTAISTCELSGKQQVVIDIAEYQNAGQAFELLIDEEFFGLYFYDELPLTLSEMSFVYESDIVIEVLPYSATHCMGISTVIQSYNCREEFCQFGELMASPSMCDFDNKYELIVNFAYEGLPGDYIISSGDLDFGPFPFYGQAPIIGPFDGNGSVFLISVVDKEANSCFVEMMWEGINCVRDTVSSCELYIDITTKPCEIADSFELELDATGTGDSVSLFINEELSNDFSFADLPAIVHISTSLPDVKLELVSNDSCTHSEIVLLPICPEIPPETEDVVLRKDISTSVLFIELNSYLDESLAYNPHGAQPLPLNEIEEELTIRLINTACGVVGIYRMSYLDVGNVIELDVPGLASGVYVLYMEHNDYIFNGSFLQLK